jgi:hypothetical protein
MLACMAFSGRAGNYAEQWKKVYDNYAAGYILETYDSTSVVCVASGTFIRLDLSGDTISSFAAPFSISDMIVEENGDFTVVGNDEGNNFIARLDSEGNFIWQDLLTFTVSSVVAAGDNGYIAGGGSTQKAVCTWRDSSRAEKWLKEYAWQDWGQYTDAYNKQYWADEIARMADGNYCFCGLNSAVTIDTAGNKTGSYTLGNGITDSWHMSYEHWTLSSIRALPDTGYCYAG